MEMAAAVAVLCNRGMNANRFPPVIITQTITSATVIVLMCRHIVNSINILTKIN